MPLFDGMVLGAEKTAIIFDFGQAYTKCGFAGENGPRCIVRSEIRRPKTGQIVQIYKTSNETELHDTLVDFIHFLYFRHLLVSPKERRVVIIESILSTTTSFRKTLAKVLYRYFEVPSLLFTSGHVVSLMTLGIPTGLVMDCGYEETVVLPVYESIALIKAWQALPVAAKAIHQYMEAKLKETAMIKLDDEREILVASVLDSINESVLEDMKVRSCFVTKLSRAQAIQESKLNSNTPPPEAPPGVEYPLDGSKILFIDGRTREGVCEVLFEQDNDDTSIATLLLDSLLKCPIDTRRSLAENLVLIGGTCMLPGFKPRLLSELRELVKTSTKYQSLSALTFKLHTPPAHDNYVAWLGGSMFGSLDIIGARSLDREVYLQGCELPDWCNLGEAAETDDKPTPIK